MGMSPIISVFEPSADYFFLFKVFKLSFFVFQNGEKREGGEQPTGRLGPDISYGRNMEPLRFDVGIQGCLRGFDYGLKPKIGQLFKLSRLLRSGLARFQGKFCRGTDGTEMRLNLCRSC